MASAPKKQFRCLDSKGRSVATVEALTPNEAARSVFRERPPRINGWTEKNIRERLQVMSGGAWTPLA